MTGVLGVYQRSLGVDFEEVRGGPIWHPEVRLFEIKDAKTKAVIGHFYLDLYPREGKYTHAAAFPLLMGRAGERGYDKTVAAMVAKNAEVNAKDMDGDTPLDWAKNKPEIADLLRKHGGKTGAVLKAEGK